MAAVDAEWPVPMPDGLDPVTAATVPLNALTARRALDLMAPAAGTALLVTGASGGVGGGVGGFAAQLAGRAGVRVLAVAGHGDEGWVRDLGVDTVVPRATDLSTLDPVPAVLDAVPVGAPAAAAVADLAAGRLRTRVAATFPLADAARAHRALEEGAVRGRIVLLP